MSENVLISMISVTTWYSSRGCQDEGCIYFFYFFPIYYCSYSSSFIYLFIYFLFFVDCFEFPTFNFLFCFFFELCSFINFLWHCGVSSCISYCISYCQNFIPSQFVLSLFLRCFLIFILWQMDSAHQDHDDKCIEETTSDQLLHPDSPDINDIFGEPLVHPRVGYEYQVEIPLMITESERDKLLVNPADAEVIVDVSHSFLMGLPIPIVQVLDEVTNIKDGGIGFNNSDDSVNKNGPLESKNRKRSQINSNKKGSKLKVESLDVMLNPGKESTATSPDSKVMGSTDLDQMHGSKSYLTVPGSLGDSWSDIEVDSFILGLYIFGKNLIQVKRFIESKGMGDILSFYYGKFYRSDGYRRWSDCRKMRRRKCIHGQKIFTGWRQQELLSRLLPQVSQECQNTLLEVFTISLLHLWHVFYL